MGVLMIYYHQTKIFPPWCNQKKWKKIGKKELSTYRNQCILSACMVLPKISRDPVTHSPCFEHTLSTSQECVQPRVTGNPNIVAWTHADVLSSGHKKCGARQCQEMEQCPNVSSMLQDPSSSSYAILSEGICLKISRWLFQLQAPIPVPGRR